MLAVLERVGAIVQVAYDWTYLVKQLERQLSVRMDDLDKKTRVVDDTAGARSAMLINGQVVPAPDGLNVSNVAYVWPDGIPHNTGVQPSWRISRFGIHCLALLNFEVAMQAEMPEAEPTT